MRINPPNITSEHPSFAALERAKNYIGFELNDGKMMAYIPHVAEAFEHLTLAILGQGAIDNGLKRMMGLIVSLSSGCTYCASHTSYTAGKYGIDAEKLESIWEFETSPLFTSAERAALNLALKSSMSPNESSDEDFDRLKAEFGDAEIVELVSVISLYAFLNKFNSTLATEIEETPKRVFQSLKIKNYES